MADVSWPIGLPQHLLVAGYRETLPDVALRTQMDAGPSKVRRRYTTNSRPIQARVIPMTAAQVAIFKEFFNDSLAGGTLAFDWLDPITQEAVEMRFVTPPPPDIQAVESSTLFDVTMNLEILPG